MIIQRCRSALVFLGFVFVYTVAVAPCFTQPVGEKFIYVVFNVKASYSNINQYYR